MMPDGMTTKPRTRGKLLGTTPELIKPRKPKILVYGPAGVGKTSFAIRLPWLSTFIDRGRGCRSATRISQEAARCRRRVFGS